MILDRIKQIQKQMNCDCIVLYSEDFDKNLFYFSNFSREGFLFIFKNKKPVLITSPLEDVRHIDNSIKTLSVRDELPKEIQKITKGIKSLGFDYNSINVKYFELIKKATKCKKVFDVSNDIFKIRSIKDENELKYIKKGCKICDNIINKVIHNMSLFSTEKDIKTFIELEIKKLGYDTSFDTVVANGKNAANAHYISAKSKLKRGFVLIDFGVKINGYCSDMTRTFYLGSPTIKEIEEYEKLLDVQKKCFKLLEKDTIANVDEYVNEVLGEAYIHSLGHGVGLDIHELPKMNVNNENYLEENQVFTIEPGVYYPNKFGIRIEDTAVYSKGYVKALTKFTKDLIIIDF